MICSLLQASGSFPAFVLGFLSSPVPGPSRPPAPHGPAATQPCRTGPRPRRAAAGPCPQPLKSGIIVSNKAPGSTGVCSSAAQPKPSIKSVSGAGSALPKAGGAPDWPWLGKFWSTGAAQKPPTCVFQSPRDGLCVFFFLGGWMFLFVLAQTITPEVLRGRGTRMCSPGTSQRVRLHIALQQPPMATPGAGHAHPGSEFTERVAACWQLLHEQEEERQEP